MHRKRSYAAVLTALSQIICHRKLTSLLKWVYCDTVLQMSLFHKPVKAAARIVDS